MVNTDKKNLRKWIEYYNKVLSDNYYIDNRGKMIYLDDIARGYIHVQIKLVEEDLKNGC